MRPSKKEAWRCVYQLGKELCLSGDAPHMREVSKKSRRVVAMSLSKRLGRALEDEEASTRLLETFPIRSPKSVAAGVNSQGYIQNE